MPKRPALRRRLSVLLTLLVGCTAALMTAATPAAAEPAEPTYHLINRISKKCLGISGGSTANGALAVQWDCSFDPSSDQGWTLRPLGADYYQLRNRRSGKCLGISAGSRADGALAVQWDCSANRVTDQTWGLVHIPGNVQVWWRNVLSNRCLGIAAASLENGALAVQWRCANSVASDQTWRLEPLA